VKTTRRRISRETTQQVHALKRAGETQAAIARQLGIAAGSVNAILRRQATKKPPRARAEAPAAASETSGPVADMQELREALTGLARDLSAAARRARDADDRSELLACARTAASVLGSLVRVTPAPDVELGIVSMHQHDLDSAAAKASSKLQTMLTNIRYKQAIADRELVARLCLSCRPLIEARLLPPEEKPS
jgi:transposase-like protein